jgi:50S ribosomal protein L16 3-hydroxylase
MTRDRQHAPLGDITPEVFMRQYWQRKPLLIRQAFPAFTPPISIAAVKKLAKSDEAESRLISREGDAWQMESGPFGSLPKRTDPDWTLLVQSVDLHDDAVADLRDAFRFIPDARLDDLMISIAGVGGGVGAHFDSYDVFLLQAVGKRHWRIGQQKDLSLKPGLPLKILKDFQPEEEFVLEPGDMLYLPPHVAHDGIALDECMTISVGFRAPTTAFLAQGMLEAAADQIRARAGMGAGPFGEPPLPGPALAGRYQDPGEKPAAQPARIPDKMIDASLKAVGAVAFDTTLATRFLGCWLTEPGPATQFDNPSEDAPDLTVQWPTGATFKLDRRTRMLHRDGNLFINGEVVTGKPSDFLIALADARSLLVPGVKQAGVTPAVRQLLDNWVQDGWLLIT